MRISFPQFMLMLAAVLGAPQLFAADGPTPYPDAKADAAWPGKGPIRVADWMVHNRASFWKLREKDQGAVVFVGDSLTGSWSTKQMAASFPGLQIANRGVGGDVSRGVLFRFQEDVLDLKPRAIVLCVGANDLSCHANPADTEQNIADMLKMAREQSATMPIVLCTVPPRDSAAAPAKAGAYPDTNGRIAKLGAGKQNVAVLDLYTVLCNAEGKPELTNFAQDKLHLAAPGYEKWAEALRPVLAKLGVK